MGVLLAVLTELLLRASEFRAGGNNAAMRKIKQIFSAWWKNSGQKGDGM